MPESKDEEQLKLLKIFHYIVGGLGCFFACFPLIHLVMGILIMTGAFPEGDSQKPAPKEMGAIFAFMGGLMFLFGQAIAWSIIYSGRQIGKREKHTFSFVVACILCCFFPFGTILGIFTILVLNRDSVKAIYGKN